MGMKPCQVTVLPEAGRDESGVTVGKPLFVFLKSDPKQIARSSLTPVSDPAFYALLHGSLSFAVHGSFCNHFFYWSQLFKSQSESSK